LVSIQVSDDLIKELNKRKTFKDDSYEDIIWDLLEETMELSEETKKNLKKAEKQVKEGKTITLEQLKKELGI
tara:strand:- start:432 stop:647 length:216 start_codon:yes stop_codon:yes gene_type:complete